MRTLPIIASSTVALSLLAGCSPLLPLQPLPNTEDTHIGGQQTQCRVAKNNYKPLVVEWPAPQRAELQARLRKGLAVVRYDPCRHEIELLQHCEAAGAYGFTKLTPESNTETIKTADQLYAKMPLGAAGLESKLERSGELNVSMTIVGRFEVEQPHRRAAQLSGPCVGATHVISGYNVGVFRLMAGAAAGARADLEILVPKAGGSAKAKHELLASSGEDSACKLAYSSGPPERWDTPQSRRLRR